MALRVKEIAKQKGITLTQIAEKLGISNVNLSASLNGNPTLNRLQEVADILEVEVPELFVRQKPTVYGYLEVDGKPYKVDSIEVLQNLLNEINNSL